MIETFIAVFIVVFVCGWGILIGYCIRVNQEEREKGKERQNDMGDVMMFPDTVEQFMEDYKITDTEQIYTNGTDLVPIFRMKQWFEHLPSAQLERKKGE